MNKMDRIPIRSRVFNELKENCQRQNKMEHAKLQIIIIPNTSFPSKKCCSWDC